MTQHETRDQLRLRARDERRSLDGADAIRGAAALAEHLLDLDELRGPGRLGTYLPVDGEIDPNRGIDRLRDRGWQVHLPVIQDAGDVGSMRFAPWQPGGALSPNRYGILEPEPVGSITARELDLVLVPCVAVDRSGNRLGFGAGFYDRALTPGDGPAPWDERRHTVAIAVAYELQLVEVVPQQAWDVPMDLVVTDRSVIRPTR